LEPGDAAAVEARTLVTSELLCESVDLHAGERVLDVACGSGNAALAAARRFCRVVGVDGDPALLARARRRADAEGLEATFLEGGADDLPFPTVAVAAPRRSFLCRFPSAEHQVEFLAAFHGPTVAPLQALGPDRAGALKAELLEVAGRFDVAEDDTLVLRVDYLEVVARTPSWR
jgi:SAM-dependent methyltransferase